MKIDAAAARILALVLLIAPVAASGQASFAAPFAPAPPGLGGSGLFVAPHGRTGVGPLVLSGAAQLEWGEVRATAVGAGLMLPITPSLWAAAGWRGSTSAAGQRGHGATEWSLAVDGVRGGVTATYQSGESSIAAYEADLSGVDVRAWARLGVVLGLSARATEAVQQASGTWERTYQVGGYDFISRRSFSYVETTRYQALELDVSTRLGPVLLTGFAGRAFSHDAGGDFSWAYVRAAAPLLRRLVLVAEAGRDAGLPVVGHAPASFARFGARMSLNRSALGGGVPPVEIDLPAPAAAEVLITGAAPRLIVAAPDARVVEVRGDFTGWEPTAMDPAGPGAWTVPVPAGVLRFDIRLDGGEWTVPGGVPVVRDEFTGALVAVVMVED